MQSFHSVRCLSFCASFALKNNERMLFGGYASRSTLARVHMMRAHCFAQRLRQKSVPHVPWKCVLQRNVNRNWNLKPVFPLCHIATTNAVTTSNELNKSRCPSRPPPRPKSAQSAHSAAICPVSGGSSFRMTRCVVGCVTENLRIYWTVMRGFSAVALLAWLEREREDECGLPRWRGIMGDGAGMPCVLWWHR